MSYGRCGADGVARSRRAGGASLALALAMALALGCSLQSDAPGGAGEAAPADPAPDFTLPQLGGDEVTLSSLRGKTVIIDFWATWCPPCEFQVPELNALMDAHAESGDVAILGVSVDTEGPEVVAAWTEEKGVRYPIVLGSEDLARKFGAVGFPTLVVVDEAGNIESRHVGLIDIAELEEVVTRAQAAVSAQQPAST